MVGEKVSKTDFIQNAKVALNKSALMLIQKIFEHDVNMPIMIGMNSPLCTIKAWIFFKKNFL